MSKVVDNKPYNGHTNWATWNVSLWLDNDEGLYKEYQRAARRRRFTADTAEDFVKELMPSGTPDFDSPAEYSDVDWDSIAECMNSELEDEEEEESEMPHAICQSCGAKTGLNDRTLCDGKYLCKQCLTKWHDAKLAQSAIAKFIERYQIRIAKQEKTDANPHMSADMDHWKISMLATIGGKSSQFTINFSQGYGHHGMPPSLQSILECLASDCSGLESASSFEDWASNLGWDTDSRKVEQAFKATEKQMKTVKRWLGDDAYEALTHIEF